MKSPLYILLIAACLIPLLSPAREETMEERKQRITRKYLRERTAVLQSDVMVPEEATEDPQITDSKRFQEPTVDLQRQEPGTTMPTPPPPPRRPPPSAEDRNWLLAEDPALADPNADPFAMPESKNTGDWSSWSTERDAGTYKGTESRFDRRSYDSGSRQPSTYEPQQQGLFTPKTPRAFSPEGSKQPYSPFSGNSGFPGQTPGRDSLADPSQSTTLFPSQLNSPFPRNTGRSSTDRSFGSDSQQQGGRSPYTSPFKTQQPQQGTYNAPQPEFQKQNPFQKWKEQNPSRFDPMRDDAFIDEVMPKTGR